MKLVKEIKSKQGVLHFRRYAILESKYLNLYIHYIHKEDLDQHLHNHPWNIFTVVLDGSYVELLENGVENNRKYLNFGYHNRKAYHKILKLNTRYVKTLAIAFGKKSDWGYSVDGKHIDHVEYRSNKNSTSGI